MKKLNPKIFAHLWKVIGFLVKPYETPKGLMYMSPQLTYKFVGKGKVLHVLPFPEKPVTYNRVYDTKHKESKLRPEPKTISLQVPLKISYSSI